MPRKRSAEEQEVHDHIAELSQRIADLQPKALKLITPFIYNGKVNVHSFHGYIGGKNDLMADCVNSQFPNPETFLAAWFGGVAREASAEYEKRKRWVEEYGSATFDVAAIRLAKAMRIPTLRKYVSMFLERNFYKNLEARTRQKPDKSLWSLWFGANQMVWGLIIAPRYRNEKWASHVSQIRRAKYQYWTVGHVLSTGLINPESDKPVTFSDLDSLTAFYKGTLERASSSQYERAIASRYVKYLNKSRDPLAVPFLIPELRLLGLERMHKYRLDYSVLNPHTMAFTGFELRVCPIRESNA